jgi:hypothetical protein
MWHEVATTESGPPDHGPAPYVLPIRLKGPTRKYPAMPVRQNQANHPHSRQTSESERCAGACPARHERDKQSNPPGHPEI